MEQMETINREVFDKLEALMTSKMGVTLTAMTLQRAYLKLEWSEGKRRSSLAIPLSELAAVESVTERLMSLVEKMVAIVADRGLTQDCRQEAMNTPQSPGGSMPIACDHNEMVANVSKEHAWKCSKCGYVYGDQAEEEAITP